MLQRTLFGGVVADTKPYVCEFCGEALAKSQALTSHIRWKHQEEYWRLKGNEFETPGAAWTLLMGARGAWTLLMRHHGDILYNFIVYIDTGHWFNRLVSTSIHRATRKQGSSCGLQNAGCTHLSSSPNQRGTNQCAHISDVLRIPILYDTNHELHMSKYKIQLSDFYHRSRLQALREICLKASPKQNKTGI